MDSPLTLVPKIPQTAWITLASASIISVTDFVSMAATTVTSSLKSAYIFLRVIRKLCLLGSKVLEFAQAPSVSSQYGGTMQYALEW